jgi:phage baseplate assembly protein W
MKKRLEADLISIAHRILQLKNKSDINQLYLETQKLYEKLSVLRFVDEHFGDIKPTIGLSEIEKQIEQAFETVKSSPAKGILVEEIIETATETAAANTEEASPIEEIIDAPLNEAEESELAPEVAETITNEEIPVTETTEQEEEASFKPAFELEEESETEEPKKPEVVQISFEDLLGGNYTEAQFVKVHPVENIPTAIAIDFEEKKIDTIEEVTPKPVEPKAVSLNDKLAKGINIDLNDRIAFTKQLFGNSSEDYNRVFNQLITFDSFQEIKDFLENMVKPDYNNWEGKEEYVQRFMDIIEKKFL